MSKRAVILHGTDGSPTELPWQGWLKNQLEYAGYDVFFPQLPNSHTSNLNIYDAFLKESDWYFTDNLIIGHSSGATAALHLLAQDWFPRVHATVLVGTFLNERLLDAASWYEPGQFNDLFVESIKPKDIINKSKTFYFVHGDDDPYCDYNEALQLATELHAKFLTLHRGGHIAKSSGITEIPILVSQLQADGLL